MAITEKELATTTEDPTRFGGFRPTTPTLAEAIPNEIKYYFEPLSQRIGEIISYGYKVPQDYDYKKYIPKGMDSYAIAFSRTTSPEHAAEVATFIRGREKLRQDMSDTPIGMSLVAALFNPINLIPIPLGHAMRAGRVSLGKTALRGGASLGALEFGMNVMNQELDPAQSWTETLTNTAMAALFGAAATGAFSVPAASRMNAIARVREQSETIFRSSVAMETMGGMSPNAIDRFAPRDSRPLGLVDAPEQALTDINARIDSLQDELLSIPDGSGEARIIQDSIEELRVEREPLADEVFFRKIEEAGVDLSDIYRPSAGLDNILIRMIPSPLRSVLFENFGAANNAVKSAFMRLVGDGGTQLRIHEIGKAVSLSVHQRQAKDMGEFATFYSNAVRLWAEDTRAPTPGSSILAQEDVNMTSIARRIQGSGDNIEAWLTEVSRKRIAREPMNPAQEQVAKLMDDYFARWEQRGIETGQLRTRQTMIRKINDLELEVDTLRKNLDEVVPVRDDDRLLRLEESEAQLAELKFDLENPDASINTEPFFSRYWNIPKVQRNRDQLKQVLIKWFTENPYIVRYDEVKKRWARIELSKDPDAVAKRADEAIDTIINGNVNRDDSKVFLGFGRPSPLAARQLNIPNSLVLDFIELNPVSVMGNYTMRTSPAYHFANEFGGSRKKVVSDLIDQLTRAGVDPKKIDQTVLRFNHLYDRVVGRVVENPDAWNQKIAMTLRDMASLTYLGGAGIAAIGDFGRVIMEHEGQNVIRAAQAMFDPVLRRASKQEVRAAGGALDMLLGSVFMRMVDDQNYNILRNGLMDKAKNVFHTMNLLGPVTTISKQFSGMMAGHHFIEISQRVVRGEASEFDIRYLARHGIDAELAARIADTPFQIDPKTGLILPNTDAWAGNYPVPKVDGNRVRVIEAMDDGSPVGKRTASGEYVPAFFRPDEDGPGGTIYFDRDYIEGEMFDRKAWTKPRKEGVNPLPEDAFKTPREWANFVMLHEIMHTRLGIDAVAFDIHKPNKGFTRIYRFAVKDQKRGKVSDWVAESEDYQNMLKATGRWFSDDLEEAQWYVKENPEGELLYVDIPTKDLESYRVSNIVKTEDNLNPKAFSARAEKELFVPRDIADAALPFSSLRTSGYENKINQLAFAEHKKSKAIAEDVVSRFRTAVNTSINNTVMMAGPADKPIMMDGVIYVRGEIGDRIGLSRDKKNPAYSRIENAFIALPLQFYSYAIANVNKTVGLMMQGAVRSRMVGVAAMMGLGYMVASIRTPDQVWQNMSIQDKIARAFDMSGIAALYSDLFYTSLQTSLALGGPNFTGGFISPRFPQKPNTLDAITGLTGAGSSWAADMARSASAFANGQYGDGAAMFIKNLPFSNLWFLRGEVNEMARTLSRY